MKSKSILKPGPTVTASLSVSRHVISASNWMDRDPKAKAKQQTSRSQLQLENRPKAPPVGFRVQSLGHLVRVIQEVVFVPIVSQQGGMKLHHLPNHLINHTTTQCARLPVAGRKTIP
eukprot:1253106-Amorphochlora_amoeboformis.AAC.1